MVRGGWSEAEDAGDCLLAADQHSVDVVLPGSLRGLVLNLVPASITFSALNITIKVNIGK